jgi:hypothetical protein
MFREYCARFSVNIYFFNNNNKSDACRYDINDQKTIENGDACEQLHKKKHLLPQKLSVKTNSKHNR